MEREWIAVGYPAGWVGARGRHPRRRGWVGCSRLGVWTARQTLPSPVGVAPLAAAAGRLEGPHKPLHARQRCAQHLGHHHAGQRQCAVCVHLRRTTARSIEVERREGAPCATASSPRLRLSSVLRRHSAVLCGGTPLRLGPLHHRFHASVLRAVGGQFGEATGKCVIIVVVVSPRRQWSRRAPRGRRRCPHARRRTAPEPTPRPTGPHAGPA